MDLNLSSDEKVNFLVSISSKMGLSVDEILAVYLLLKDRIFFLFDLLQGKNVKFPSMSNFRRSLSIASKARVIKLSQYHYLINGVDSYREDIVRGDTVHIDGVDEEALGSPINFFGDSFILVKDKEKKEVL